jgi:hypothetical protein
MLNGAVSINIERAYFFNRAQVFQMEPKFRSYSFSVTNEDVEWFKNELDKIRKSDPETKKKFFIRVGYLNEDGSVADPYKGLFPGKE